MCNQISIRHHCICDFKDDIVFFLLLLLLLKYLVLPGATKKSYEQIKALPQRTLLENKFFN
jgi:hypothetical protein